MSGPSNQSSFHVLVVQLLFWLAPWVGYFLWPDYQLLLVYMMVMGLFALSLNLLLGVTGILSLGHALFFGTGAYIAGLLAVHGWHEPISALLAAFAGTAVLGWTCSFLVLRTAALGQLVMTLALGLMGYELANRAVSITGGVDGLWGMQLDPLLGQWAFDFQGQTAFVYCYLVLLLCFLGCQRLLRSPFGVTLRAIRDDKDRLPALGISPAKYQRRIYTLSAALAGVAGALLAQSSQFVALDSLGFQRSAEALMMIVLGGLGSLYGALVGAVVFVGVHDYVSALSPWYWQLWLGIFLVAVVLMGRGGILGGFQRLFRWRVR